MKDRLKKIFEENKDLFFEEQLSEDHLTKFERKLDQAFPKEKQRKPTKRYQLYPKHYMGIAAGFLLILTLGIILPTLKKVNNQPANDKTNSLQQISSIKQLREPEMFFSGVIKEKIQTLKTYQTAQTKPYIDQCFQSLDKLNSDYTDLKKDFEQTQAPKILDLMLNNLKQRIVILDDLTQKLKYYETKSYQS